MASLFALSPSASSSRQLWRFGLISGGLLLLWAIGSMYGLGANSAFDLLLCHQLAASSAWLLNLLGWPATVDPVYTTLLLVNGKPSVIVGPPCDGLVLYVLLAGFVLAYPGPPQRRPGFIALGIVALWLLNVGRIVALALNHQYSPTTFDFNHHYVFSAVAYAALAGMWLLWTRQGPTTAATLAPAEATAAAPFVPVARPWLTPRIGIGLVLLVGLVLVNAYQDKVVALLSAGWSVALVSGPAWLHRLPGANAGDVPGAVSHLPLPVGAAFMGLFLGASLLILWLLLPARGWRLAWRSYASVLLAIWLLMLAGRAGAGATAYHFSRMLTDSLASLLPVFGLLVLLWRQPVAGQAAAAPVPVPAELADAQ